MEKMNKSQSQQFTEQQHRVELVNSARSTCLSASLAEFLPLFFLSVVFKQCIDNNCSPLNQSELRQPSQDWCGLWDVTVVSNAQLQLSVEEAQSQVSQMEQVLGTLQEERDEAQRTAALLQGSVDQLTQVKTPVTVMHIN